MPEDRRLAAIMFTDIVGYTALMGSDEDKAFQLLRKNRDLQRPIIKKYRGEWLKEMGDGILASFSTASDAVRCAGEIQNAAKKAGIGLRIGIHEGEVVFEGSDVLGDGVNVASRLEELAEEGCINISGAVYKDIKNKAGIEAEFIEEKTLKNVDDPVKVYKVHYEEPEEELTEDKSAKKGRNKTLYYLLSGAVVVIAAILIWYNLPKEPATELEKSIAVLPFRNDSEEEETEYFANGIMEGILNNLAKISELRVPGRTSVEQFRETSETIPQIGDKLNVSYLLEGSVQKFGDQVMVNVQLLNASEDKHLWSNSFKYKYESQFEVIAKIAEKVAEEIEVIITPQEKEIIESIPTTNLIAYDFFLRARDEHSKYWLDNNKDALDKAIILYRKALEIDSTYAQVYTGLAFAYWNKLLWEGEYYEDYFDESYLDTVLILADIALTYDNQLEEAYYTRGIYFRTAKSDYNKALNEFEKALQINPNYSWAYWLRGSIYADDLNNYIEGLKNYHKAASLDHSSSLTWILRNLARTYGNIGFVDKAHFHYQEALKLDGDSTGYLSFLQNLEYSRSDVKTRITLDKKIYDNDSTRLGILSKLMINNNILGNNNAAYNYALKLTELIDPEEIFTFNSTHRIGYAFWQAGKKEEAKFYFDMQIERCMNMIRLNRPYATHKRAHYDLAGVYVFLGDKEKAYQYLDEFNKKRCYFIWEINLANTDPLFTSIRDEERFQQVLQNMEAKYQKEHERVRVWLEQEGLL
ncbi:adenylate/guanylate cyclase domain-containing protein [Bacteroidota bacterium]